VGAFLLPKSIRYENWGCPSHNVFSFWTSTLESQPKLLCSIKFSSTETVKSKLGCIPIHKPYLKVSIEMGAALCDL
jgi:hypothetical protein